MTTHPPLSAGKATFAGKEKDKSEEHNEKHKNHKKATFAGTNAFAGNARKASREGYI